VGGVQTVEVLPTGGQAEAGREGGVANLLKWGQVWLNGLRGQDKVETARFYPDMEMD